MMLGSATGAPAATATPAPAAAPQVAAPKAGNTKKPADQKVGDVGTDAKKAAPQGGMLGGLGL